MAEAQGNGLPSGYDEDFVNEVEEDLRCLICHLTLKSPIQTRCGHRFCEECLQEHLRRQGVFNPPTCPMDRRRLNRQRDLFPDTATERKILSLAIKCPSDGCDWTGELRNKENHLQTCSFKVVICTNENCQMKVRRMDLQQHLTTCQWRIIRCRHCGEQHPHCLMEDHFAQCSQYPVPCPINCGGSFPRETIPNHTKDDCPLKLILCPYAKMGCKTQVQRKEVESHLQSAVRLHLDLACVKLNETEVKLNNTEVKLNATEEKTRELMKKFDELQRQLNGTQQNLDKTKNQVMKFDTNQAQFSLELNSTKLKLNNTEVKFNDMQEKLETNRKQVEKLDKPFVCTINNFSNLLKQAKAGEATSMYSKITEICGYKLRVRIYPNGVGSGKNTHLSVFIYIMKGEYDAILPWPFIKKVKFTLIDQQEDPAKRINVTNEFMPGNVTEAFARPTQEENPKGWGFNEFISHEKLHSRRYLEDDTLFLQVEIGP